MLCPRDARTEKHPSFTFPTIKLKNITCIFCNHKFFVRDLTKPRGSHVPLLLGCGHAACHHCVKNHIGDPCPLCGPSPEAAGAQITSPPPVNIYIIGLLESSQAYPSFGDEPDISFSHPVAARTNPVERYCCSKCQLYADLRCYECDMLLCRACYNEGHGKSKMLMDHCALLLPNSQNDTIFQLKTCDVHNEAMYYYCNDCHFSSCHHCMLLYHQRHDIVPHTTKNQDYILEFKKVKDKMATTLRRIHQTQKVDGQGLPIVRPVINCN